MEREYKAAPAFLMGIDGRTVTGIYAVHGNVDDGGDRSYPGLFGDFTVARRKRARFLWQHDGQQPPIATIDDVFEVSRADLPESVLSYAPNATGGVAVKRTYLQDDFAERVFGAVRSGALTEMSYAYEPSDWNTVTEDGKQIRELYKADLYDISDVNWGMNPATSADGLKGQPLTIEATTVRAAVERHITRLESLHALRVVKEGRRFSSATLQEITETLAGLKASTARLEKLIAAPDDDGKTNRRKMQEAYQQWQEAQRRLRTLGVSL